MMWFRQVSRRFIPGLQRGTIIIKINGIQLIYQNHKAMLSQYFFIVNSYCFPYLCLAYNRMNINFIRNLSDEILRENQQLKSDIITIKQKLSDYQEEMMNAVRDISAPMAIAYSPKEMLKAFIKAVKQTYEQNQSLIEERNDRKIAVKSLELQIKMIEEECLCKDSELQLLRQRQEKLKEERQSIGSVWQEQKQKIIENSEQLSKELIELRQQMRLDKLMITESKRRQIQEIRQYHLKEFLQFRQKSQKEVVFIQRQMQQQMHEKDKMIKDLQKTIQKLSNNIKLEGQSQILIKLFKSFQEYNHLSKTIQQRSEEISRFRQQVQELEYGRIKLESKVKEVTMNELNITSQLQRMTIEKKDLQSKLNTKNISLLKSEQDKQAMEEYYDKKWNQEYKKVKIQLEKTYAEKMNNLEEDCTTKLTIMSRKMHESQVELRNTQDCNKQLEKVFKTSHEEVKELTARINRLMEKVKEVTESKGEVQQMAGEELRQVKISHHQAISFLQVQLRNLNSLLSVEKQIYEDLQNKHKQQLQTAIKTSKAQADKLLLQKQHQKKQQQLTFQKTISKLQNELQQKKEYIQDVRVNLSKEITEEYNKRFQFTQREIQARNREKQEQIAKKNDKWMSKYKEMEQKFIVLKKKTEEEQDNYRKEIGRLQTDNQGLKSNEAKHHAEIKDHMMARSQLLTKIGELQKKITAIGVEATRIREEKLSLEDNLEDKDFTIAQLREDRNIWLGEISQVQKSYRQELQCLKKIGDKQLNILKSKIWQLQQMVKKRPIKRKDYQKMIQMDKQRKHLRNQIYVKQAENIILNQVKDYYQSKLKEQKQQGVDESHRASNALMGFKLKMLKKPSYKQAFTEADDSREMIEMKKYIVKSTKKSQNMSLSKMKFQDIGRYHRFNTTHQ